MLIQYKVTIRHPLAAGAISFSVSGIGEDEKKCKRDAQTQVRNCMKALNYKLESVEVHNGIS